MSKLLGIDVGERKIGLAIADTDTKLAFIRKPLLVADWAEAWPILQLLIAEENISRIIVGWPQNTDGSSGPQARRADEFIQQLRRHVQPAVIRFDERMTTQAVQREQQGRKLERGQEDSLAAQLILENYLQS